MRDLYVKEGFKRLQLARLRDFQSCQQFHDRVFPANIFDRGLGAEGRITGQDQNGPRRVEPGQKADDRIVLRGRLICSRPQECL